MNRWQISHQQFQILRYFSRRTPCLLSDSSNFNSLMTGGETICPHETAVGGAYCFDAIRVILCFVVE